MNTEEKIDVEPELRDYVYSVIFWFLLVFVTVAFVFGPATAIIVFTGLNMGLRVFLAFVVFFICLAIALFVLTGFSRTG